MPGRTARRNSAGLKPTRRTQTWAVTENQKWGIIAAKGGELTWNINDGILLLNLDHPAVRSVLLQWWENFDRELPEEKLAAFPDWSIDCKDDQRLLHEILAARPDHTSFVKIESFAFMGWPKSRVFRQLLRITGSMEQRCSAAEAGVKQALALQ